MQNEFINKVWKENKSEDIVVLLSEVGKEQYGIDCFKIKSINDMQSEIFWMQKDEIISFDVWDHQQTLDSPVLALQAIAHYQKTGEALDFNESYDECFDILDSISIEDLKMYFSK